MTDRKPRPCPWCGKIVRRSTPGRRYHAACRDERDKLGKLAEGRESVLAIPGLGEKSLEEIEKALRAGGLLE